MRPPSAPSAVLGALTATIASRRARPTRDGTRARPAGTVPGTEAIPEPCRTGVRARRARADITNGAAVMFRASERGRRMAPPHLPSLPSLPPTGLPALLLPRLLRAHRTTVNPNVQPGSFTEPNVGSWRPRHRCPGSQSSTTIPIRPIERHQRHDVRVDQELSLREPRRPATCMGLTPQASSAQRPYLLSRRAARTRDRRTS